MQKRKCPKITEDDKPVFHQFTYQNAAIRIDRLITFKLDVAFWFLAFEKNMSIPASSRYPNLDEPLRYHSLWNDKLARLFMLINSVYESTPNRKGQTAGWNTAFKALLFFNTRPKILTRSGVNPQNQLSLECLKFRSCLLHKERGVGNGIGREWKQIASLLASCKLPEG